MACVSAPDLLALLALRLRTLADVETIATATGLTGDSTAEELSGLAQKGWVRHRDGRVEGWMLTPEGRDACAAELAAELDGAGREADVVAAYERFLSVNQPLLDLCTDWQLREAASIRSDGFAPDRVGPRRRGRPGGVRQPGRGAGPLRRLRAPPHAAHATQSCAASPTG